MSVPPTSPDDGAGPLEDRITEAAERLERLEEGLSAAPPEAPPGSPPEEFKMSSTRLLHELRMLRGDIVKMREEAALMRATTVPRLEFELRRRHLRTGLTSLFVLLVAGIAMFLVFEQRSQDEAARFEQRTQQFQREAIAACEVRNARVRNEHAFADNVLKILATTAARPADRARNPNLAQQYAAAVASHRRSLGTVVDCAKQARTMTEG